MRQTSFVCSGVTVVLGLTLFGVHAGTLGCKDGHSEG